MTTLTKVVNYDSLISQSLAAALLGTQRPVQTAG
jgi:hypothetical protein